LIRITLQKLNFVDRNKFHQFKWAVVRGCSRAVVVVVVVAVVCGMAAAMVMVEHGVVIVAMAYMQ
jgi:hypothetical protein